MSSQGESPPPSGLDDRDDELRKLRRLQVMVGMVISVFRQDADLTLATAQQMMADCRRAALAMFPGKELAFDLIYKPRLERALKERFGA